MPNRWMLFEIVDRPRPHKVRLTRRREMASYGKNSSNGNHTNSFTQHWTPNTTSSHNTKHTTQHLHTTLNTQHNSFTQHWTHNTTASHNSFTQHSSFTQHRTHNTTQLLKADDRNRRKRFADFYLVNGTILEHKQMLRARRHRWQYGLLVTVEGGAENSSALVGDWILLATSRQAASFLHLDTLAARAAHLEWRKGRSTSVSSAIVLP
jgi:hypothetical protein